MLVLSRRGRRLRRWSFLLTVPAALASALWLGVGSGLGLVALRLALWLLVIGVAWRVGGERGEAVRDLLMHPAARRYARLELRVLGAPVAALGRLLGIRRPHEEFAYHRGDEQMAIALALTPAVLVEALVFQLLLPHAWFWVHVATAAVHVYGLVGLFALAAGPRLRPHRLTDGELLVRSGVLHEVRVPLGAVIRVEVRGQRTHGRGGLSIDGSTVLLPARRRVDVWLDLDQAVSVSRPVGEPVLARRLGIAADDPERLAGALAAQRGGAAASVPPRRAALPALVALPELAYGS